MKKFFAIVLFCVIGAETTKAQVERKEIDIEAYGEHTQILNVGKDGLVFFHPLEQESRKDKDIKWRLQCYDKDLEPSWNQEFSLNSDFQLLKFEQKGKDLFLLYENVNEYMFYHIGLIDGEIITKLLCNDKMLPKTVTDFDVVSTNLFLHAQEKSYPLSFAIDLYTGRTRQIGDEETYGTKSTVQRVGTGTNKDLSGYWDFINEMTGLSGYDLKMLAYDGAGAKLSERPVVLGSNKILTRIEIQSIEGENQYILGSFGKRSGAKLKQSKDLSEIISDGNSGFVFGKINSKGNMLFMNTIELKQVKSFMDMARQIPALEEQISDLENSKKRIKSPGILNPIDEENLLTHDFKFHSVYNVDELTKIVVLEFFHPESNYADKQLPEFPLKTPKREKMLLEEAEDLVEAPYRGIRSSALLIMAFSNLDGSLLWDYSVKLDGSIMDDSKQRAKLVCKPDQVVVAYGADNTVVTKTLQQGAVVDNAITSVPAPSEEGSSRRKGKGTITSGLMPWHDNIFIQYEYSQVKVKKSKSKKKKKRKTTYSFTVLPVYN